MTLRPMARLLPGRRGALRRAGARVKVTGLAQNLGQPEAVNRDLQSKSWADLQLLGQPCNFRARGRRQAGPEAGPAPTFMRSRNKMHTRVDLYRVGRA